MDQGTTAATAAKTVRGAKPFAITSAVCALAMVALGIPFAGGTGPGGFDRVFEGWVATVFGGQAELLRLFVVATQPYVLIPVLAVVAIACGLARRGPELAVTLAGPAIAVALNTWVLKPLFDRHNGGAYAYPSGHTVSLVSTLAVLVIVARPGAATWLTAALAVLLVPFAAVGMVGLGFHYLTDVIGGTLFAIAFVLATRLAGLAYFRRHPWPARLSRP
ncbi:phosphatase PAP2 family protein [Amycolatopsis minnesotensis]|uniref:Phosphatase PAP2 family protein n=1 Tax=Amycolatopsis minnesotensis TaxID=337894 RepID=A0ABN2Q5F8_9PSEU